MRDRNPWRLVKASCSSSRAAWGDPPEPKQGWWDTDDAPPRDVLAMVRLCAASWVPEARLLGNVRAGDIVRALDAIDRRGAGAEPTDKMIVTLFRIVSGALQQDEAKVRAYAAMLADQAEAGGDATTAERLRSMLADGASSRVSVGALRAGGPPPEHHPNCDNLRHLMDCNCGALSGGGPPKPSVDA